MTTPLNERHALDGLGQIHIGSVCENKPTHGGVIESAIIRGCVSPDYIHIPQVPQLKLTEDDIYTMDPEAVNGLPFITLTNRGLIVYDFPAVTDDDGGQPGQIVFKDNEQQESFETLELQLAELIGTAANNDEADVRTTLGQIKNRFPKFGWHPEAMEKLVSYVPTDKRYKKAGESLILKFEMSGPINTAISAAMKKPQDKLQMNICSNNRLLQFHAGLIFARSLDWALYLKDGMKTLERPVEVICSFDEPRFEDMDKEFGPRKTDALQVYNSIWGSPHRFYHGMVHVCGSFIPELMYIPQIELLNFDAWNKSELVEGHDEALKEFFRRGGYLVAGIIPTNYKADLIPFFQQKYKVLLAANASDIPFIKNHEVNMLNEAKERINLLFLRLQNMGIPFEQIRKHVLMSPQCGLGGLIFDTGDLKLSGFYTSFVYNLLEQLANELN